ncbi:MAG: nucleotidyl transferase AbiEii/AbiGii toxin family protein [Deltaproteobacteria bacterium]|nr:nucleotidyl transferase AbiEii/AbiGii toxin family protein [Deltaproteobacteria bacterium]
MGKPAKLAKDQQAALGRLKRSKALRGFYLAGGSAIAAHLGHRRSIDLDLFSADLTPDLTQIEDSLVGAVPDLKVISKTDAVLKVKVGTAAVDIVRYRYPPLEPLGTGPSGFPLAGLLDLAVMKLAAISSRGIKRDFWDLYEIVHHGVSLSEATRAYVQRFGTAQSDLYHVVRSLTYFGDAERKKGPAGLDAKKWREIKLFFKSEAGRMLA